MSSFSFYSPLDKGSTCYQSANGSGLFLGRTTATQYLLSGVRDEVMSEYSDSRSSLISTSESVSSLGRNETIISSSPTSRKALIGNQIQLRFLNPGDYETVKTLCEDWFPVEYPAKWFEAITSDTNLFSLAAVLDGRIVGKNIENCNGKLFGRIIINLFTYFHLGLIVAELKQGKDLNREDRDILCDSQLRYTAAYILSLGVVDANR